MYRPADHLVGLLGVDGRNGRLSHRLGLSLVFPALGVEAVKQVEEQNQGTALGTYSAFLDLALGLTGPVAGWVAGYYDLETIYLLAAAVVALAFILILRIYLQQRAALPRT